MQAAEFKTYSIMKNGCYSAVNRVADLSGNKCIILWDLWGHIPELWSNGGFWTILLVSAFRCRIPLDNDWLQHKIYFVLKVAWSLNFRVCMLLNGTISIMTACSTEETICFGHLPSILNIEGHGKRLYQRNKIYFILKVGLWSSEFVCQIERHNLFNDFLQQETTCFEHFPSVLNIEGSGKRNLTVL